MLVLIIRTVNMFMSFYIALKKPEKIISYLCIIKEYIYKYIFIWIKLNIV